MSEEKKKEILCEIKDALEEIPAELRQETTNAITHDIGVMAKAIKIATAQTKQ